MNKNPNLLVFASGSATGGGSGFEELVQAARRRDLQANIVAVVSNHERGGVQERAERLQVPFVHFPQPWSASRYAMIVRRYQADFTALSGWLKLAAGLNPATTFNIHPGPLPEFGGSGMYGHHVHEAVLAAYRRGQITHSAVSMHFVTEAYDRGPVFCHIPVAIEPDDTPETLGTRVNQMEHRWQSVITDCVVNSRIKWDGVNPASLWVAPDVPFLPGRAAEKTA